MVSYEIDVQTGVIRYFMRRDASIGDVLCSIEEIAADPELPDCPVLIADTCQLADQFTLKELEQIARTIRRISARIRGLSVGVVTDSLRVRTAVSIVGGLLKILPIPISMRTFASMEEAERELLA